LLAGLPELDAHDVEAVRNAARSLWAHRAQIVVVTLGESGAIALEGDAFHTIPGRRVRAVDPTGAGDCLTGALAARLAAGDALLPALRYANVAASLCVQRTGAAPSLPTGSEVEASE
jgi:ribokinase